MRDEFKFKIKASLPRTLSVCIGNRAFADVLPAFNAEDLFDVDLELMAFLIDFCIVNWIDRIRFSNVARGFLAFYFFFVRGDNASVRTDNFGVNLRVISG